MALLIGYNPAGIDGKVKQVIDEIVAAIQVWAGKVEGINAAERLNQLTTGLSSLSTPQPGFIQPYAGSTAPTGWLLCDGTAVSRETYANLFTVIGITYGAGNGSTTFNVPDLRQRFPLGKAASGTGATLGATGGTIDHVHTGPSHTHGAGSFATPSHDHGGVTGNNSAEEEICQFCGDGSTLTDVADTPHTHSITSQGAMSITGTSGASGTGNTGTANPPFLAVQYLIKT